MFMKNYLYIEESNANEKGTMVLGLTRFAAMNVEEFKTRFTSGFVLPEIDDAEYEEVDFSNITAPASVDWVSRGAVTPV